MAYTALKRWLICSAVSPGEVDFDLCCRRSYVASYVYHETSASREFEENEDAVRATSLVVKHVKELLTDANGHSVSASIEDVFIAQLNHRHIFQLNGLADSALQLTIGKNEHERPFIQTLLAASQGSSRDALAAGVFAELVPTAMPFARAICQVIDYYLCDERCTRFSEHLARSRRPDAAFDKAVAEALGMSDIHAPCLSLILLPKQMAHRYARFLVCSIAPSHEFL